ncbi:hypothetical protein PAXRUDRAFT_207099 [Paxillus rubicundulus Ve08.2h10]|uniref:Uncharacterized protein n=1 Tax=Paxillus rubicundulus Ve08.2h10 TaxID=930991 RepID=A0A0D0DU10_9AGAM|nr:hypothetical protein PAXRUDRAFT_207099 [Paxillus rubicundulus Ve08.2h10]
MEVTRSRSTLHIIVCTLISLAPGELIPYSILVTLASPISSSLVYIMCSRGPHSWTKSWNFVSWSAFPPLWFGNLSPWPYTRLKNRIYGCSLCRVAGYRSNFQASAITNTSQRPGLVTVSCLKHGHHKTWSFPA